MIVLLYSTVGAVVVAGYLPQIIRLYRSHSRCDDIALPAWWLWNYTAIVSFFYGHFVLADLQFTIVNCIAITCNSLIISITLYKRWKYAPCSSGQTLKPVSE